MRIFILPVALLSIASSAYAGERYVEVWNPPEARSAPARPAAQKKTGRKMSVKKPSQTIAKKVTDPAASTTSATGAAGATGATGATSASASPRVKVRPIDPNFDIPRKIGPDGHVLRV